MMEPKKNKISVKGLLFVAAASCILIALGIAVSSNNMATGFSLGSVQVTAPPSIRQIEFSLSGERILRQGIYIPHGATIEKEKFQFNGTISTRNRTFNVALVGFEPIAIIEFDQAFYLLTREPFRKYDHRFYQMIPSSNSISYLPIQSIPLTLLEIDFQDQEDWKHFRSWVFNELVAQKNDDIAFSLFQNLFKSNNRFLFPSNWTRDQPPTRYLFDFLMLYVAKQRKVEYYPLLLQSLKVSKPNDDPNLIADICYALLELDPLRAKHDVCDFRRSARQERVTNDSRLAIGLKIDERQLDCDALRD